MNQAELELSRRVLLRELPARGKTFRFEATEGERIAVARRLGLIGIENLKASLTVTPAGSGALARGRFEATVIQQCVVTLEPVSSRIEGEIEQRFEPGGGEPEAAEIIFDPLAEEPPELLCNGAAELGELVVENLALALDPYPRAPGAHVALPEEIDEGAATPFAKLRDMKFSATEE